LDEQFQGEYFDAMKETKPVSFTPPEGACKLCARRLERWNDTDICNTCRRSVDNVEVLESPH
jgi:predicted amidophosphoribosyltransferase